MGDWPRNVDELMETSEFHGLGGSLSKIWGDEAGAAGSPAADRGRGTCAAVCAADRQGCAGPRLFFPKRLQSG